LSSEVVPSYSRQLRGCEDAVGGGERVESMLGRRAKVSKGRVRKVRLERWDRGGLPAVETFPEELVVVEEALLLCF
jgi:hypothetical protein